MATKDPDWFQAVRDIFDAAGVPLAVWVPIMLHESNGRPWVVNDTRGRTDLRPGTVPELSVGLFQVNIMARMPNATAEEQNAELERLKDPIANAKARVGAISAAWAAVKPFAGEDDATWAPLVAVRSGHPGGSVQYPCKTDWCNYLFDRFYATARDWLAVVNTKQPETGNFIGDWMSGVRVGAATAVKPYTAGAAAAVGAVTSAAGAGAGAVGSAAAGAVSGAGGAALVSSISGELKKQLAAVNWARVLMFVLGAVLFLVAFIGIVWEPARKTVGEGADLALKAAKLL